MDCLVAAERWRLVDGDAAELELLRDAKRCVEARRENAGLKPEAGSVGELDRLVERVDGRHGANRTEDLLARDLVVTRRVGDQRRPDQLAGIRDQITAIRKGLQRAISSL